jgi:lipopolysaccharide heptosyltransferase II
MGIGNAVMFEPLLHALRERFPGAHLAVTVDARAPSLAVFRWPGLVDEVIVVRGSSRLARAIAGLRLARRRWDLCLIRFNGATRELVVAAIFGRIRYRVGHVSSGRFSSELDWLFNLPVTMDDYDHEVDRHLALVERLGQVPSRRAPFLAVPDGDRVAAERVTKDLGLALDRPLVAVQPGTSSHQRWKRWPTEHWRALAGGLADAGFAVIALGSADERGLLNEICHETGAINAAGVCSLRVTAAVLERCELLVCTDSALMHIAGAVGTPIICIFGPTDRTRTRPYGTGHTMLVPVDCRGSREPCLAPTGILSPDCTWRECMRSIRPEAVLTAVRKRCWASPLGASAGSPARRSRRGEMP